MCNEGYSTWSVHTCVCTCVSLREREKLYVDQQGLSNEYIYNHVLYSLVPLINPLGHACAVRVTVLGLCIHVCVCMCVSVFCHRTMMRPTATSMQNEYEWHFALFGS